MFPREIETPNIDISLPRDGDDLTCSGSPFPTQDIKHRDAYNPSPPFFLSNEMFADTPREGSEKNKPEEGEA